MTPQVSIAEVETALVRAASLRAPLSREKTTAYRLVNGAGDCLPGLTVDVYAGFCTLNVYEPQLLRHTTTMARALLSLGFVGVYLKVRVRADLRKQKAASLAPSEPIAGRAAPEELVVQEYGMKMGVHLADGLSTGLFVDQRANHRAAGEWAREGRVLNLFCYTCAFSVSAAMRGAATTNVDLAAKALGRGRRNFELNGLGRETHRFFKEDAMKYLEKAVRRSETYDLVVLDPPTFATVGKHTFSVKESYAVAAESCVRLLSPGGRLLAVTNHTQTTSASLLSLLREAGARAGRGLVSLKALPPGPDCPSAGGEPWPSKSALLEVE